MFLPPRFPLAALPTPITDATRLRAALGGEARCPRILIKRDDLTALGLGGNKARKLEFLIADALAQGAHTVITTGAVQSNHARMTAAAAAIAGLRCVLVLSVRPDQWLEHPSGAPVSTPQHLSAPLSTRQHPSAPFPEANLLLDYLFGAEVRFVPADDPMLAVGHDAAMVAQVVEEERAAGRVPYVIPVGGSSPVGALGYVTGTQELVQQLAEMGVAPVRLYYASGSRGTQAGLTLGAKLHGAAYKLWGVAVSAGEEEKIERARKAANAAAALMNVDTRVGLDDLFTDQGFIGDGYGIATPGGIEAIRLLARTEAILLDPVYTSKAFAALIQHVRGGAFTPDETIVFLHTGGSPALFSRNGAEKVLRG
ncbi:MAG: D-cysteine desulfhydrase family protein, partial [Acidobacteria bacterium]|nr:D-cysteine desulfhydrase family protein [Acidobacteriota bacterium]